MARNWEGNEYVEGKGVNFYEESEGREVHAGGEVEGRRRGVFGFGSSSLPFTSSSLLS